MLKGISPIISPDLLKVLAEMGHGDEIIFADAHFPVYSFNKKILRHLLLLHIQIHCATPIHPINQLFFFTQYFSTTSRDRPHQPINFLHLHKFGFFTLS